MRYAGLFLVGMCYVTYFLYMDWHGFLIPFTNWALMITTASLVASIQACEDTVNFGKDAL